MTPSDMRRAAKVLRREARSLKETNAIGRRLWVWHEDLGDKAIVEAAKADYDVMMDLARKLTQHARNMTPLGAGARGAE